MNRLLKSLAICGMASLPIISNATTDWTPFLQPLTKGCDSVDFNKIPATYKSSIVSKKQKGVLDKNESETSTIVLKNATAFGSPLVKIESDREISLSHQKIYFKDARFMSARSKFKLPNLEGWVVEKNDTTGYSLEASEGMDSGLSLNFDKSKKTISCTFA